MRKTIFALLALSTTVAGPAPAAQQAQTAQQRRDIERRIDELEQEMRDLRRQLTNLDDGPGMRVRATPGSRVMLGPRGLIETIGDRPKLGFVFTDSTGVDGAMVVAVTPGAPAERAGLKAGDVITMFNGVKLEGRESPKTELRRQAENIEVGDTVQVEYRRAADRKTIKLVAEDLGPNVFAYGFGGDSSFRVELPQVSVGAPEFIELGPFGARWLDMELVSVERELGEYFGTAEGVLVVRAPRDSSLSLKSGDVILSIDGRKALSPTQVMRVLRSYGRGESFEIQVLRQKRRVTVKATAPERDRGFFYEYDH